MHFSINKHVITLTFTLLQVVITIRHKSVNLCVFFMWKASYFFSSNKNPINWKSQITWMLN